MNPIICSKKSKIFLKTHTIELYVIWTLSKLCLSHGRTILTEKSSRELAKLKGLRTIDDYQASTLTATSCDSIGDLYINSLSDGFCSLDGWVPAV